MEMMDIDQVSAQEDLLENENLEIKLLLDAIYFKYSYDFRDYAKASLKRRIKKRLTLSNLKSISEMQHELLYNIAFFESLLLDFSINVTEMFRDPSFYLALREKVFPVLKIYPFLKIWHAGCSTGEEAYSIGILLHEEQLYERTQIYATDFNEAVLKAAQEGIYSMDKIKTYTTNYQKAGGLKSFSDYYTAKYDRAIINNFLKKNILFADHNLVTDWGFGEMNVIFCRNVLIYFNKKLQNRAIQLFTESLCCGGYLCLGSKESIQFSQYSDMYEVLDRKEKIYQKKYTISQSVKENE
ncbi:MAG: CheR family methyltransferase [bacterium]